MYIISYGFSTNLQEHLSFGILLVFTFQLLYSSSVLSAAVEALTAFIRSFVCPTVAAINGVLLQPVLAYLSG